VPIDALEPEDCPTLHSARAAGAPVDVAVGGLAADALGARRLGDIAWSVNHHIAHSHLLADASIREAQQCLWREMRLAVEPAAALPLAALRSGVVRPSREERVALVLCGANLDPATLA
jgi:threonine dehydratase